MQRIIALLIGVMTIVSNHGYGQTRLVVLGSSTSAGTGASVPDSAWVNRFQAEYAKNKNDNQDTTIINLAVGGYVTFKIMPNEYSTPAGKPLADTAHNVTKALSYAPSVIIINLPTNDVGNGYSRAEFIGNLRYLYQYIQLRNVKAYITTTQPRSQYDSNYRSVLHDMVDSIKNSFGNNAIDFWTGIATTDSLYMIRPELNSGDGVHLNDKGHGLLFEKAKAKNVFGTQTINNTVNIHLEAEKWSAMSGVSTENTADAGGTQDVGWIDNGDWMEYNVNVPVTGSYIISFRLASPYTDARLQVKNGATVLSTVPIPFTGAWQSWQTVSTSVSLPAGTQTIRLQSASAAGWNINWLEIKNENVVAVNQFPSANAGADKTITLPTNSVTLSGSGSDPDGSIASYSWTKVSGGAATITSPSSASTTLTGLVQGSYTFRLTVSDNAGASASDDVTVTINGATGGGSSRIEAENWSAMSGVLTENCSEGTLDVGWIDNGDWMEYSVNVPAAGNYTLNLRVATPYTGSQFSIKNSSGTELTTVSVPTTGGFQAWQTKTVSVPLAAGTQTIRLQSTSGAGWNINWLEIAGGGSANQPPSANAGADQAITLPINTITLTGTGTDKDGSIVSYSWSKLSGGAATIGSVNTASTTISGLTEGSYQFRLTVIDNNGATATDDVMINVAAAAAPGNTTHIEAEKWTTMYGVMTENCSDAGGTQDVGWIDMNDWLDYTINVPAAGSYTLNLRLATPNTGAQFQIKNSGGTVLSTVAVPITGGWQSWQTVTKTINLVAGTQTIRLQSTSGAGWNINWLDIIGGTLNMARQANTSPLEEITTAPSLQLYPNPMISQGTIHISNAFTGPVKLCMYSMNGALVQQMEVQKTGTSLSVNLPVHKLSGGQYILKASMKEWNSQIPVIKQ